MIGSLHYQSKRMAMEAFDRFPDLFTRLRFVRASGFCNENRVLTHTG